jgi:hypothetical protein
MSGGQASLSYRMKDSGVRATEADYRASMYATAARSNRAEAQTIGGAGRRANQAQDQYRADIQRRQQLGAQMGQFQGQQDKVLGYLSGVAGGQQQGAGTQAFEAQQADAATVRTRAALANRTAGAAAMRQAQNANEAQAVQGIQQGMAVRAQDQDMARAQMAQYLSQGRGAAMDLANLESDRAAAYRQAGQEGDMYRARTEQALALQNLSYQDTALDRTGDMQMQYWQGIKSHNDRVRQERKGRGMAAAGTVASVGSAIL